MRNHQQACLRWVGPFFVCMALFCCSEASETPKSVSPTATSAVLPFSIRGTLGRARELKVHVDHEAGPLGRGDVVHYVRSACDLWEVNSPFTFKLTDERKGADVVVGWRANEHVGCRSFTPWTGEFAHTTEIEGVVSIHLAGDSDWSERGGESRQGLLQTLLHEFGHVLGLDHTTDERTLMYPAYDIARDQITAGERAGMAALYGGATELEGSLLIENSGEVVVGPLIGVAPHGEVLVALADVDDSPGCEILIYPATKAADPRGLMIFHYREGEGLYRTTGPIVGALESRYAVRFVLTHQNAPAVLMQLPTGRLFGRLMAPPGVPSQALPDEQVDTLARDLGVGVSGAQLEPSGVVSASEVTLKGDIDGDGRVDTIRIL